MIWPLVPEREEWNTKLPGAVTAVFRLPRYGECDESQSQDYMSQLYRPTYISEYIGGTALAITEFTKNPLFQLFLSDLGSNHRLWQIDEQSCTIRANCGTPQIPAVPEHTMTIVSR